MNALQNQIKGLKEAQDIAYGQYDHDDHTSLALTIALLIGDRIAELEKELPK